MKMSERVQNQVFRAIRRWQANKRWRRIREVYYAEHGYFPPGLTTKSWARTVNQATYHVPQSETLTSRWFDLPFKKERT